MHSHFEKKIKKNLGSIMGLLAAFWYHIVWGCDSVGKGFAFKVMPVYRPSALAVKWESETGKCLDQGPASLARAVMSHEDIPSQTRWGVRASISGCPQTSTCVLHTRHQHSHLQTPAHTHMCTRLYIPYMHLAHTPTYKH